MNESACLNNVENQMHEHRALCAIGERAVSKQRVRATWCVALSLLVMSAGCQGDDETEPSSVVKRPVTTVRPSDSPTDEAGSVPDDTITADDGAAEASATDAASAYGNVTGQFAFKGALPQPEVIVAEGDAKAKDPEVCAAQTIYSEKIVVDAETMGIRHVFVYLRKASKVHPDLASSAQDTIVFDQKFCRFEPHTLLVRTDQTVLIKSGDPINHNTNIKPVRRRASNFLMTPNDRKGVPLLDLVAESKPFKVNCDVHPWMEAWWLVLDHPYAAITDEQGRFTIENLPAGEHELRVWHEGGYYDPKFAVTVAAGQTTTVAPIELSLEQLRP